MSKTTTSDQKPAMSWSEKKKDAARQAREKRQRAIEEALERDDVEEYDRLVKEASRAKDERLAAKVEGRKLKQKIKDALPAAGGVKWADNETAKLVRQRRNAPGVHRNPRTTWNMQPGDMVRLVNKAEAWTESYMQKILPKGSIGILLDPPVGERAAVMFGADVYTIACKKLRPITEED